MQERTYSKLLQKWQVLCRLGVLFKQTLPREEEASNSGIEGHKEGQCQLSSGCMPSLQPGREDDEAPGWVKELERVTLKVKT